MVSLGGTYNLTSWSHIDIPRKPLRLCSTGFDFGARIIVRPGLASQSKLPVMVDMTKYTVCCNPNRQHPNKQEHTSRSFSRVSFSICPVLFNLSGPWQFTNKSFWLFGLLPISGVLRFAWEKGHCDQKTRWPSQRMIAKTKNIWVCHWGLGREIRWCIILTVWYSMIDPVFTGTLTGKLASFTLAPATI